MKAARIVLSVTLMLAGVLQAWMSLSPDPSRAPAHENSLDPASPKAELAGMQAPRVQTQTLKSLAHAPPKVVAPSASLADPLPATLFRFAELKAKAVLSTREREEFKRLRRDRSRLVEALGAIDQSPSVEARGAAVALIIEGLRDSANPERAWLMDEIEERLLREDLETVGSARERRERAADKGELALALLGQSEARFQSLTLKTTNAMNLKVLANARAVGESNRAQSEQIVRAVERANASVSN